MLGLLIIRDRVHMIGGTVLYGVLCLVHRLSIFPGRRLTMWLCLGMIGYQSIRRMPTCDIWCKWPPLHWLQLSWSAESLALSPVNTVSDTLSSCFRGRPIILRSSVILCQLNSNLSSIFSFAA